MRTLAITCLLCGALAAAPAAAENESAKDAFRQTEKGMGRLLEAMGSEVKKLTAGEKKDEKKKPAARKAKEK
ncbi:MAG: hypothetical protein ACT4P3_07610 [Betaproteobacteria bacterium]